MRITARIRALEERTHTNTPCEEPFAHLTDEELEETLYNMVRDNPDDLGLTCEEFDSMTRLEVCALAVQRLALH